MMHRRAPALPGWREARRHRTRSSVRSWAYDGMAGRRTGRAGVRAARAGAVRRSQTQDDRHLASRRVTADLRDRGGLRGWRTGLWLDAERAQGRGSPSGSAVRAAQRHGRPGRGLRGAVAGRGEDLRSGDRFRTDHRGSETAIASTPTSPRSCTPTSTSRRRCSSSSGGRRCTGCGGSSASDRRAAGRGGRQCRPSRAPRRTARANRASCRNVIVCESVAGDER